MRKWIKQTFAVCTLIITYFSNGWHLLRFRNEKMYKEGPQWKRWWKIYNCTGKIFSCRPHYFLLLLLFCDQPVTAHHKRNNLMDHIHRLLDATSENDIQSRKKALTPQLLFSVLPWCVHESLPIASPELYCSSLSNKSNPAWKDEFVLSQTPMSKLLSSRKKQSKTEKDFPRIVYIRIQIFFHLLAKR